MIRSAIHRALLWAEVWTLRATIWCSTTANKYRPDDEEKLKRIIEEVRELSRKDWN